MIIMLILNMVMRIGECLQITRGIGYDDRTIYLPAENTKSKRTCYVLFSVKTAWSLQRWIRYKDRYTSSKLLFPKKCAQLLNCYCCAGMHMGATMTILWELFFLSAADPCRTG